MISNTIFKMKLLGQIQSVSQKLKNKSRRDWFVSFFSPLSFAHTFQYFVFNIFISLCILAEITTDCLMAYTFIHSLFVIVVLFANCQNSTQFGISFFTLSPEFPLFFIAYSLGVFLLILSL